MIDEKSENQMHQMLAGVPGAGAKSPRRISNQLPALQPADYIRYRFGRQKYPACARQRQGGANGDRSPAQGCPASHAQRLIALRACFHRTAFGDSINGIAVMIDEEQKSNACSSPLADAAGIQPRPVDTI